MQDKLHPEQLKVFRSMTPEQKWRLALRLYDSAWELKQSAFRLQHPDWSEEEIERKVKEVFFHARS